MLHHLDDDLLHHCLGLLAPQDLSRCAAITRRLLRLASDESLWRPHFDALPSAGTAVALTVPTRLAFAAVSLISAARLNAASAERLRTRGCGKRCGGSRIASRQIADKNVNSGKRLRVRRAHP